MKNLVILFCLLLLISACSQQPGRQANNEMLYAKNNLLAWCIIPYDDQNRNPEERALMLKELGIQSIVWDWREEHLPLLEKEIAVLKQHQISLKGVWFWMDGQSEDLLNEANESILQSLENSGTETTLWVSFPGEYFEGISETEKVDKAVLALRQLHARSSKIGCNIALYNHGDWFGEPKNQVKIIEASGLPDIGLVYNFHHAHDQLDEFQEVLEVAKDYLWTVNLNGMNAGGPKILPIGKGTREIEMMSRLKNSGFNGSIGIIGHTEGEDVQVVLTRNLDGMKEVLSILDEQRALSTY